MCMAMARIESYFERYLKQLLHNSTRVLYRRREYIDYTTCTNLVKTSKRVSAIPSRYTIRTAIRSLCQII